MAPLRSQAEQRKVKLGGVGRATRAIRRTRTPAQPRPHKFDKLGAHKSWRSNAKSRLPCNQPPRNPLPLRLQPVTRGIQHYRVRPIQKQPRRVLKVRRPRIQHRQIQVRQQKPHHTVRLQNCVLSRLQLSPNPRHHLTQHPHPRPHPQASGRARRQKTRRIRSRRRVLFHTYCHRVIGRLAVARLPIRRAEPMPILRNLHRRPSHLGHRRNQPRHHGGLPNVPGMPAHDDNRHRYSPSLPPRRVSRASVASSFRYARSGLAGVPQNTVPAPRRCLCGRIPAPEPTITPSPIDA